MKSQYIITQEELAQRGLNLYDYANEDMIPAIINIALDTAITRCCTLNDNFKGQKSVEKALDEDVAKDNEYGLVDSFKKLQFRIMWNLIFTATDDPVDLYVDSIIVHELGWGKINGFQKGFFYKVN